MSSATTETSEMAILRRIVDPEQPFLSAEAAQAILRLDFSSADRARMNQLAAKNREGKLTPAEEQELNQTTGLWHTAAQVEKTQAVRSERSRTSGEVEERAVSGFSGLRLRCATLRPNGESIHCQ